MAGQPAGPPDQEDREGQTGQPDQTGQPAGPDAAGQPGSAPTTPNAGAVAGSEAPTHQAVEPSSAFATEPSPDTARNLARADARSSGDTAGPGRKFARGALFVPKLIFVGVMYPFRQGLYLFDRYNIAGRLRLTFFNDKQTFGIYPVALFETGFGLNIGARLIHKDLFGHEERLRLRASFGGVFDQLYRAQVDSGRRFNRAELELVVDYEVQADANFFGIGNGDVVDSVAAGTDPYARDDLATHTRFRQNLLRAEFHGRFHANPDFGPDFDIDATVAYRRRDFDDPERGTNLDEVWDPAAVIGFQDQLSNLYTELALTYDSTRPAHRFVWAESTGWRAHGFVGYTKGFSGDPSNHLRYGVEVGRLFDLYMGNRILALRGYLEGVTAERDDIPFVDLPRLGGVSLLRGYDRNRFRDRVAALAAAEYQFSLARFLWSYLYVDVGRVYPSLADFTVDDLRLGFGGGFQLHSQNGFQGRFHIGSSIDGGLFFALSFNPALAAERRTKRK